MNQHQLWKTPYRKVSARYAKRKPIPSQKCDLGSTHGLRVIYSDAALADLEQITEFIARDNAEVAERFANRLVDSAESLRSLLERGRTVKTGQASV